MLKNKQLKKQILIAKKNISLNFDFQLFFNDTLLNIPCLPDKNKLIKINKFVIKYSNLFPKNYIANVKFPLQALYFFSLDFKFQNVFSFFYDKLLIKVSNLFIKLKSLNILKYYNSKIIFFLLNSFLNEFFFDLNLYYKCISFNKTLN
jgi:hypothetical protein